MAKTNPPDAGTVLICPMRDGPCPHGIDCKFVGDGPYGYPCKDGWRINRDSRALQAQDGRDG